MNSPHKLIKEASVVITSSIIVKSTPIISGFILTILYGELIYSNFVHMLVFSSMISIFISSGLGTVILKEISGCNKSVTKGIISQYIATILLSSIFIFIFIFIFYRDLSVEYYVMSLGLIFFNFFYLILNSLGYSFLVMVNAIFLNFLLIFIVIFTSEKEYNIYYSSAFLLSSFVMLSFLIFNGFVNVTLIKIKNLEVARKIYKAAGGVLIPNVIIIISIYQYHTYQKNFDVDNYYWFALGYQVFSFLLFIPSSLTPLVVREFILNPSNAKKISFKLSFISLFLSFVVLIILSTVMWVLDFEIFNSFVFWTSAISGVFASAIVPITQYLVSVNKFYYMLPGSLIMGLILHCSSYYNYNISYFLFLLSYVILYITVCFFSFFINRVKV